MTEADICRLYVTPALLSAGWDSLEQIREQYTITHGRVVPTGKRAVRKSQKRADYVLHYRRDYRLAVVEAKKSIRHVADGLPQAKEYAQTLGVRFAYATNGRDILEFDSLTGELRELQAFPSPEELWSRANHLSTDHAEKLLTPSRTKQPLRYYQDIAINRAVEAILSGQKRVLLTLATGTGKTAIAAQISWKLWSSRWNVKGRAGRRPRILFLADRNFLVDDPYSKDFAIFGEARWKIQREANTAHDMYFAIYQAVDDDEWTPGLYREYPRDFFDLVIVDECHRGSAKDESNWREILNYFHNAVQVGMTATPLREDNRDSYAYFGNPLYVYSLQQGIDDGFLAPYRVHRIVTNVDLDGYRPGRGERDKYGEVIPDRLYKTPEFERDVVLKARTRAIAQHLTDFLKKIGDRFAKTIIFCVDQDHAANMLVELSKLNQDMLQPYPDYVVRITANDGDIGKGYLSKFTDVESKTPVLVTTSQLLTTGVDVPTCRVIAIARPVNSIVEFKQIIGRGTRIRDDFGKLWFDILDYTGSAVERFSDPEFDGFPALATQAEIDAAGQVMPDSEKITMPGEQVEDVEVVKDEREVGYGRKKFVVEKGFVEIVANVVYELDPEGTRLRSMSYTQYAANVVQRLYTTAAALRQEWASASERSAVIAALEERGVSFDYLAELLNQLDADPFDLICHVAFQSPVFTRRERSDRLKRDERAFFEKFTSEARQILNEVLEKYIEAGVTEFKVPDILKLPPVVQHGNVMEISQKFGGAEKLRATLTDLQTMLYADWPGP
ncbi:MAG: EcoAI/FtnUII family type I restriction enzme subunit R [Anaerolineales bacterium]